MSDKRKFTILHVDDDETSRYTVRRIIEQTGYEVKEAATGTEALQKAQEQPDLIVLDVNLPDINGFEVCKKLKADPKTAQIPVLHLSATFMDDQSKAEGLESGADGYLTHPVEPLVLIATIKSLLRIREAEKELRRSHAKLERNLRGMIDVISETIEMRGLYPPGHHQRVAKLAVAVAREIGLTDFQVEGIEFVANFYDIGLINIPSEILQNDERLDGTKLTLYRNYPGIGHNLLKKIEFPWPFADIVLQHGECFDGSGFPHGIKGEEILIEARVLAVAAALDGLMTHKSFRNAFPLSEALEKISSHSGSKYDPKVVDACLRLFKEKGYKMGD